jgi:hypothetical protein
MARTQRAIRIDEATTDAVQAIADEEGRTFSDVFRRLVAESLSRRTRSDVEALIAPANGAA